MAASRFNPYRDWLGLAKVPSNYYELLQLPLGEAADEQVRSATARALSTLRRIKPGGRQQQWRTLLDQLEEARDCLLSVEKKARYDELLRQQRRSDEPPATRAQRPSPVAPTAFVADPMAPVDFAPDVPAREADAVPTAVDTSATPSPISVKPDRTVARARISHRAKRRHRPERIRSPLLTYGIGVACFAGLLATFVAVMVFWIQPRQEQRAERRTAIPSSAQDLPLPAVELTEAEADPPAELPQQPTRPPAPPSVNATDAPAGPSQASAVPPSDAARELAQSTTETNRALREAYRATVDRRWADADQALALGRRGPGELLERVERFATLKDYAQQYWNAVEDGLQGLEGTELTVDQTRLFVVDVNDDSVLVRIAGQNRRYPRDALPDKLALAVADRWFDAHAKSTPVFRGTFMLLSGRFSNDDILATWQIAQDSGVDLGDLTRILDDIDYLDLAGKTSAADSGPLQLGDQ